MRWDLVVKLRDVAKPFIGMTHWNTLYFPTMHEGTEEEPEEAMEEGR